MDKPSHLAPEYAAQFKDQSIVHAYQHRAPYPEETFEILQELMAPANPWILDLGCGPGDLARYMTTFAERVDAIDFSEGMIAQGRTLEGGERRRLTWIVGSAEESPLTGQYGLITAAESIHWMEWKTLFPRLRRALAPGAFLAIVEREDGNVPWPLR